MKKTGLTLRSNKLLEFNLVSFIEKGYDFVLDADVSSGEKEGGDYLVFVELDRTSELPAQIIKIMQDLMNLTGQNINDWRVRYYKSTEDHELDEETLRTLIPSSPKSYSAKFDTEQSTIDSLKVAAGVDVNTTAPVNEYTESLRIAAGLK